MRTIPPMPLAVKKSLKKLGADLRSARIRRRLTAALVAERAFISRVTLLKVERGNPSVSFGIYATVLFVLGLHERINLLADVTIDEIGLDLEEENLPKRVRLPKRF